MLRGSTETLAEEDVVLDFAFRGDLATDTEKAATVPKKRKQRRTNEFISKRQTTNLIAAFKYAEALGLPLNTSVDIAWIFFSGNAGDRTRFAQCQRRLSRWARRKGFPLTMIWTREVGKNGSPHTHVLLHVPPLLTQDGTFKHALERSLEPEGGPLHDKAILIQRAYFPLGKLYYNLKGTDPKHASIFSIRPAYQGLLSGKRAGCTQNLSVGARHKATTREVENPYSVASAGGLSAPAISGSSEIPVHNGRSRASKFSSGDAHSAAGGRKLSGAESKPSWTDQSSKPEMRVPPAEVSAQAIKVYQNDRRDRWRVGNYLPSGRRRQQSFEISQAEVLRLLRAFWPSYITDQIRIANRRFGGDINSVPPRWQGRLEAALDREADARRAYSGRREKWEQEQRERERLRPQRMPSEQRRALERKEHDRRLKAINAEFDEREKAGAVRALIEVKSHVRHGRIGQVQHLLAGVAEMGSEGVTASDISYIVAPRGARLLPPEERDKRGREIAEALVAVDVLVAVNAERFVLQQYATGSRRSVADHCQKMRVVDALPRPPMAHSPRRAVPR